MIISIRTTHKPATDLGFLLHKNPGRVHEVELAFGKATVFYPEANDEGCTAALLVDVDPVGLVRGRRSAPGEGGLLRQYLNHPIYIEWNQLGRGRGTNSAADRRGEESRSVKNNW